MHGRGRAATVHAPCIAGALLQALDERAAFPTAVGWSFGGFPSPTSARIPGRTYHALVRFRPSLTREV